jgi:membrane protease YdiL (CAAX protease family)
MDKKNNLSNYDEPDNQKKQPPENDSHFLLNGIRPKISPILAAFIGLVGGFFLYQFVGGFITILIFGFNFHNAPVNSIRLMTMASQILFILLPALIFSKMIYEDVTTIIRFHFPKVEEILLFLLGIIVLTPLLQYYLSLQSYLINILSVHSSLIHFLKEKLDELNNLVNSTYNNLLSVHSIFDGGLVFIIVAIVPAICEETMFRGFIQRSFEFKLKPYMAALLTAVFFAIYHFNPYGLIPLFVLGFYFGFAAYKSDSIFVPMSLHFFNNFVAFVFYLIYGDDDAINSMVDKNFDLTSTILTIVFLTIVFLGIIYLIRRYYSKRTSL